MDKNRHSTVLPKKNKMSDIDTEKTFEYCANHHFYLKFRGILFQIGSILRLKSPWSRDYRFYL